MKRIIASILVGMVAMATAHAEEISILFVGNSFTYTRPPVLQYNIENVEDLNYPNFLANPTGSNPDLPQPWGGVPGVFQALAEQAGLDYQVSHSLRGGATLRGHYLNSNPANWDMRANIAAQTWDVVVLQGNSTEALARAGGNPLQFGVYVDKLERWIHEGAAESFRESALFPGGSNALRTIPANDNADPSTLVYLYQTWARPDLTYPAGSPYEGEELEVMTQDLASVYREVALANRRIAGIAPVGEAFMRAVQEGVAISNPYEPERHGIDLWWHEDQFHSSKYGSYLSALVVFGTITGIDPVSFGANERAAWDLGIEKPVVQQLQRVASEQLAATGYSLKTIACLHAAPMARAIACRERGPITD